MEDNTNKIKIYLQTYCHIISAHEFEFVKKNESLLEMYDPCTVYMYIQRPLLTMRYVVVNNGVMEFEITDDSDKNPLKCKFDLCKSGFFNGDDELEIKSSFIYEQSPEEVAMENYVDIKIITLSLRGSGYCVDFSAERVIYEYINGNFFFEIDGCFQDYMDYDIHYIGRAFDQEICDRISGNKKGDKLKSVEKVKNVKLHNKPTYEISVLTLSVCGAFEYSSESECISSENLLSDSISNYVTKGELRGSMENWTKLTYREITNEVEALLINKFKPKYNKIHYKKYPKIAKGAYRKGYSGSNIILCNLQAILSTESYTTERYDKMIFMNS